MDEWRLDIEKYVPRQELNFMIMLIKCCYAFISLQRSRSKTEPATATQSAEF